MSKVRDWVKENLHLNPRVYYKSQRVILKRPEGPEGPRARDLPDPSVATFSFDEIQALEVKRYECAAAVRAVAGMNV